MAYQVQTPVYDGPFDLLLHLILREQVDLYEVSLSAVVEAYLGELERMEHVDLEVATEFLLIAATLVELKARRLLPGDAEVDLDDELALWEERDLLLARLLECKTFKDASRVLARLADAAARSWPRRPATEDAFVDLTPDVMVGVTPEDVRAAFLRATAPRPTPRIDLDHVAPIGISVADAVAELVDELPRIGTIGFRALTASLVDRLEVVVRFLAVLELCKQGLVDLDQRWVRPPAGEDGAAVPGDRARFGDIRITWIGGERDTAAGGEDGESVLAGVLGRVDAYEG
ncbi:MAG TPA: segregation/condensation protein A [Acidimicrobiales bacterium]|nr:segregation/condensation protein A [Acidimicrobiales bacterium]